MKKHTISIEREQMSIPVLYDQQLSITRLNEMYVYDGVTLEVEDGKVARMIVEV